MDMDRKCRLCNQDYKVPKCYINRGFYCSKECFYKSKVGKPSYIRTDKHREFTSRLHKGKKLTPEQKEYLRQYTLANPQRYWLGKKRPSPSIETREKMRQAALRNGNRPPIFKKTLLPKNCPRCAISYQPKNSKQKYCSKICYQPKVVRIPKEKKAKQIKEYVCLICSKLFIRRFHKNSHNKYCSISCRDKGLKGKTYEDIYGDRAKEQALKRGDSHVKRWDAIGRNPKDRNKSHMTTYRYNRWRRSVYERDNYTCQRCYKRGVAIQAHHIKSWKHFIDLRYEIENGKTVCIPCHVIENRLQRIAEKCYTS